MANTKIDLSSVRFLVVDDNHFIRRLIREILLAFGALDVEEASNAADALDMVSQQEPDIIFCDWMMQPMDGLRFLKTLRAGPWASIPVILVTGHATRDHVAAALGDGADSYIVKPFRATTLLEHIVKVAEASRRQMEFL